ncbi:MAG: hypothetical protein BWY19_00734 [bacterium ADurb.Bin212]|nr:MAG: hypothetical protein BWY19_00734 [bacterium ADurb.Bin212]
MSSFDYDRQLEIALNLAAEHQKLKENLYIKAETDHFLSELFAYSDLPIPNDTIYKYFTKKDIVDLLYTRLCYYKIPQDVVKKNGIKVEKASRKSKYFYQIRRLGQRGSYPDVEIKNDGIWYFNHLNIPFLITRNHKRVDDLAHFAEYAPFSRQEIRIATSIICSHEFPITYFYFDDFSEVKIDEDIFSHVDIKDLKQFLATIYLILVTERDEDIPSLKSKFRYVPYGDFRKEMNLFLKRFSIRDNLMLRTSSHLVKAGMLKTNYVFFEETLSNSYFALEGCMLLLQRKYGIGIDKLRRKELREIFINTFKRGEEIFDYLSEVIDWGGKRAELVHPAVASQESWLPTIFGDDHEYHDLTIQLMYYIVTNQVIQPRSKYGDYIELL